MVIIENKLGKAVSELKSGKSGGEDMLVNEFLVHGSNVLYPYILQFFNSVFDLGVFLKTGEMASCPHI